MKPKYKNNKYQHMKKMTVAIAILLLITACQKKESKNNLHITGNIKGLKTGTIYIQRVVNEKVVNLDTIKIDGSAAFESDINLKSPEMLSLFLDRGKTNSLDNSLYFFAEPGNMTIETDLNSFYKDVKITGSKNNDLFLEYSKINARFRDVNLSLLEQKLKNLKLNNAAILNDSLQKLQDRNQTKKYLFALNFAVNHKEFEIAPYIALTEIYDINIKYLDTIQKSMTPKVAQSLYGKKLTDYVGKIKAN
jgi:Domain of unknown function (DUF4369)